MTKEERAAEKEREAVVRWLRHEVAGEATRMILVAGIPGGTRTQRTKNAAFADGCAHAVSMIIKAIERCDHLRGEQ